MMDFVKKSIAFSVGAAAFSAEKLKQFADEMVSKGEMTADEANKFVDDVSKKAEDEKKSLQEWMREQMNKMILQAGAADAVRVADLESRVTSLERQVAGLIGQSAAAQCCENPEGEGPAAESA